eukprot:GHVN01010941.1.p1 GENE.GHVN01010941.1~~GHVN01010941.1.p1  ORF type:complete len:800 (-),score=184.60 GHVN01010941.1:180-2579(-)
MLTRLIPPSKVLDSLKMLVRRGVSDNVMEGEVGAGGGFVDVDKMWNTRTCLALLEFCQCIGSLDCTHDLETICESISCVESEVVQLGGVRMMSHLVDNRRRKGLRAKAVTMRHGIMKCLELTLPLMQNRRELRRASQFAITTLLTLLADPERPDNDKVEMSELATTLLTPYLLQSQPTAAEWCVGLRGLFCFWVSERKSVKEFIITHSLMPSLVAVSTGSASGGEWLGYGTELGGKVRKRLVEDCQSMAAEMLMHAMEFNALRGELIESDALQSIASVCSDYESDITVACRAKLMATLTRLCVHSESSRQEVFKMVDFNTVAMDVITAVIKHTSFNDAKVSEMSGPGGDELDEEMNDDLDTSLLEVLFFLSIHEPFKISLLQDSSPPHSPSPSSSSSPSGVLTHLVKVGERINERNEPMAIYIYVNLVANLLRSREDKPKTKKVKGMPDLEPDQLEQLEQLYEKLPENAKGGEGGKFDLGTPETAAAIRAKLLNGGVVKVMAKLLTNPVSAPSPAVMATVATCIRLLCVEVKHRGIVIHQGGLAALLLVADALDGMDEQREARQALAQLCITVNPNLLTYPEVMGITPHLVNLLKDKYELYQFEAAMGLTNVCSTQTYGEEVRNKVWFADGWHALVNCAFSDNDMLRGAALEGMCNMAMCEHVQEAISKGKLESDLRLLLAFTRDVENVRAISASAGCLAILTSDPTVALKVANTPNSNNVIEAYDDDDMKDNTGVMTRLEAIVENIASAWSTVKEIENTTKDTQSARDAGVPPLTQQQKEMLYRFAKVHDRQKGGWRE